MTNYWANLKGHEEQHPTRVVLQECCILAALLPVCRLQYADGSKMQNIRQSELLFPFQKEKLLIKVYTK